tara:strand:+ start:14923 stop:15135 length:213 start_codon:yes stop_codon:yes gene_type:complete
MDELEFRKRVYGNPRDLDKETLEAARANPGYQKILDETLALEDSLAPLLKGPTAPENLMANCYQSPRKMS